MLLSLCSYVIRVWGYTLLTPETIHYIFALEMLHGVTFALMWVAAVDAARVLTPPGWGTTIQSLLGSLYGNLGQGIGAIVGGYVMDAYGGVILFRACSLLVLFMVVCRVMAMACSRCVPPRGDAARGA